MVDRHKCFVVCNCNIKFSMATEFFSIFSIWRASDQSMLSLKLASTTADQTAYPFRSGFEVQITILPGRLQVPVLSLHAKYIYIYNNCINTLRSILLLKEQIHYQIIEKKLKIRDLIIEEQIWTKMSLSIISYHMCAYVCECMYPLFNAKTAWSKNAKQTLRGMQLSGSRFERIEFM